ncbi:MAG: hypothetical protein JXA53_09335 [Bacteroidales bacterium]|nr:hypothetical protein [Bacteroidales bacterium]
MQFPEQLKIIIRDKNNKLLSNIVIALKLFAKRKNNYHIISDLSNSNGEIIFNKKDIEEYINTCMDFFIMDYTSTLEDCKNIIELQMMSNEEIKKAIEGVNLFKDYFRNSLKLLNSLHNARNSEFNSFKKEIKIDSTVKIIELEI